MFRSQMVLVSEPDRTELARQFVHLRPRTGQSYPKGTQMVYRRDAKRGTPDRYSAAAKSGKPHPVLPDNLPGLGKNRNIPDWDQGIGRLISREKKEKKGDLTMTKSAQTVRVRYTSKDGHGVLLHRRP